MPFDFGWDFRSTLAYVTDPAYATCVTFSDDYPHTFTNADGKSINAGWTASVSSVSNRDAAFDPRLAGTHMPSFTTLSFRVDLGTGSAPGAGLYTLDGAFGRADYLSDGATIKVKDNTTEVVSLGAWSVTTAHFLDITGVDRSPGTGSWDAVRATTNQTFATTTVFLEMNNTGTSFGGNIAHFRLILASAPPPASLVAPVNRYARMLVR
jgi:hypothetical protein